MAMIIWGYIYVVYLDLLNIHDRSIVQCIECKNYLNPGRHQSISENKYACNNSGLLSKWYNLVVSVLK